MKIYKIAALLPLLALAACGNRNSGSASGNCGFMQRVSDAAPAEASLHAFPTVNIPMVYGDDPASASEYSIAHYWDAYFSEGGRTDAGAVLGVSNEGLEQALANYISLLSMVKERAMPDNPEPLTKARKSVRGLFSAIERKHLEDTSAHVYPLLTELVSKYLYDPNSPLRDEDLYLPFVEAMERSAFTSDDMRAACRYEASQCRTNPFGSTVPDIRYSDVRGRKGTLYGVKADYTMLFFSNPGCNSCKEIIGELTSRDYIDRYIADGKLAIVNIYIDEEVGKWRDYVPNYPSNWVNGYDYTFQLRDSGKYDIRAIPSLYLLDSSKRVLMKDAPTERVLSYLDKI
ncbi:MAG: DUF5106 domain-containing protein [Bacteroidales bacterium]|nr:DUF5106 domain-containing protein [Bacteroidales bacterium]